MEEKCFFNDISYPKVYSVIKEIKLVALRLE